MQIRVVIRQASPADVAAIYAAEVEISRTPGALVSAPDEISPAAIETQIDAAGSGGCYLVAESNGKLVGHAFLNPMDLRAVAHVYRLTVVVHPDHSGCGVGTTLMAALREWAEGSPKVQKIELLVRATNRAALALYAKSGFVEEGRLRKRVRLPDGEYVDDIAMAWFPGHVHA